MVEVRGLLKQSVCLGPRTMSKASEAGAQGPGQEQGRGNRMAEGSGSSTEHFQMAAGTEVASRAQGGSSLALALSLQILRPTPPHPQPHSIARLPRKLQEAWGRRRTSVGVCRASASEGCLRRAADPADPETSVWKLENVTQKEAQRRRGHSSRQQPGSAQGIAGRQEPTGLGQATWPHTPAVLEGEGGLGPPHANSRPPVSREKAGGSASFSPTCLQREP